MANGLSLSLAKHDSGILSGELLELIFDLQI